jgi:hypothetical protein
LATAGMRMTHSTKVAQHGTWSQEIWPGEYDTINLDRADVQEEMF